MVALPNTEPPMDDVSVVEFLARRAARRGCQDQHLAAATKGLKGRELTEIGCCAANGAVGFTDGVEAVADALVMRRLLSYARSFDQLVDPAPGGAEPRRRRGGSPRARWRRGSDCQAITRVAELIMVSARSALSR